MPEDIVKEKADAEQMACVLVAASEKMTELQHLLWSREGAARCSVDKVSWEPLRRM